MLRPNYSLIFICLEMVHYYPDVYFLKEAEIIDLSFKKTSGFRPPGYRVPPG
jgi:hypothetical protein